VATTRRSRLPLSHELQVRVFRRDRWLCHWCHRPVVFAPALRLLEEFARRRGYDGPLAYHDARWRRDRAPVLDHLAAVVDHVEAFSKGGAHDEANFVTACNKCNARKNNVIAEDFKRAVPSRAVKGKYGEPAHWDGFSTLFVLLARDSADLPTSERRWLAALTS
jgi:5-methylcytosine-specific restriction endonuclease McrA